MIEDILISMLWSVSPFGEAKIGIPYGMYKGVNIYIVFALCFLSNLLVFPIMMFFLETVNRYLLRWTFYKKMAINIARRAKVGSGEKIKKYGFWGLLFFVMLPVPGTGVYAGSIASYIFKIKKDKAFVANTVGIFLSSVIVWVTTLLAIKGLS